MLNNSDDAWNSLNLTKKQIEEIHVSNNELEANCLKK